MGPDHPPAENQQSDSSNPFHVGMRTFKTALSVSILVFAYQAFSDRAALVSCISAIVAQKTNIDETRRSAWRRVLGTALGALASVVFTFLADLFHAETSPLLAALLSGIGIITLIVACNILEEPSMIIATCAVFLIIYLGIPQQNKYLYIFNRVLDTFIGGGTALIVEILLPRRMIDRWQARWAHLTRWIRRD